MVFPLLVAVSLRQGTVQPFMRFPDIHGDQIVFTSEGDLWLANLKSGESHRLTSDAGTERNASFSPDGTQIAFEAEYDGQRQAYVMPTAGGTPRKITSVEGFRAVTGWTADGKNVVVRYVGTPTSYYYATVAAAGGAPVRLPLEFASHVSFGPTADRYVFTRFSRWSMSWFRYIGGMQNQVWIHEPGTAKEFRPITDIEGTNEFPTWCGDRIYFANELKGHFTLMSVPISGGKPRKEVESEFEIRELSTDGSKVIFENGRDLQIFDPVTKGASKVDPALSSDLIHARTTTVLADAYVQDSCVSATGKRVVVESRGQLVSAPVGEGEARIIKATDGVRYRHPALSADSKKLAYVDDSTGEEQLYVSNADGSEPKQLTKYAEGQIWGPKFSPDGKWIGFTDSKMKIHVVNVESTEDRIVATIPMTWREAQFEFSPDSNWIAYTQTVAKTFMNVIELYHIPKGMTYRVSDARANDFAPAFSDDGKYLVYVSNRHINTTNDPILNQLNLDPVGFIGVLPLRNDLDDPLAPKDTDEPTKKEEEKKPEFRVDIDGLFDRRVEIPVPPAAITKVVMTGNRIVYSTDSGIKFYDLGSKSGGDLAPAPSFNLSSDGKNLLLPGRPLSVVGINGGEKKNASFGSLRLKVNPAAEWKQIFWDAWRHMRDYFYVPNMHGLDWKAIGNKYAASLPAVRSREELDELIRWFQSEVGSSHEYLQPGDRQDIKPRVGGAYLGAEFQPDSSGYYKFSKIYKGDGFLNSERSPLIGAGKNIQEGMFLIALGGETIKTDSDPLDKLVGRAGQVISVTVNDKPTLEGAKTYLVKPVASEMRMRYLTWVESNRAYVSKKSGGKLGYLHLAAMSNGDMNDFVRQYFAQRDKEGFVIDGRFNNGGFVQDYINRILNESLTGLFNMRNSPYSWTRQQDYFTGPMALLINEFDISCGEEFPHRFRDLKRGPLIGRRTMGGEVGSDPGWSLVDGGTINVPNYGMWTPDGKWAIEGLGVAPDIDVPSDPNAFVKGIDPQIDKAIEYLLDAIKRNPTKPLVEPPAKDRVKNGGA